jgi:hypothetical protein
VTELRHRFQQIGIDLDIDLSVDMTEIDRGAHVFLGKSRLGGRLFGAIRRLRGLGRLVARPLLFGTDGALGFQFEGLKCARGGAEFRCGRLFDEHLRHIRGARVELERIVPRALSGADVGMTGVGGASLGT